MVCPRARLSTAAVLIPSNCWFCWLTITMPGLIPGMLSMLPMPGISPVFVLEVASGSLSLTFTPQKYPPAKMPNPKIIIRTTFTDFDIVPSSFLLFLSMKVFCLPRVPDQPCSVGIPRLPCSTRDAHLESFFARPTEWQSLPSPFDKPPRLTETLARLAAATHRDKSKPIYLRLQPWPNFLLPPIGPYSSSQPNWTEPSVFPQVPPPPRNRAFHESMERMVS